MRSSIMKRLEELGLLHNGVQTVANIEGDVVDIVDLLQHLLRLLPLLNLPLPLVGGTADVDELLVALICDDGVPDLLSPPRQNLILNLLRTLRVGDRSVELGVSYLLLVAGKPSADENDERKIHEESGDEREDKADTEEETEDDVLQGGPGNAQRQQEDGGEEKESRIENYPGQ